MSADKSLRWSPPSWPAGTRSCSSASWSSWAGACASSADRRGAATARRCRCVHDARVVVDQAATEMVRVGDVLDSAEAVSSTVDSASRLAYRAFSNPVVKVLAYSTGLGSALRRFFGRRPALDTGPAAAPTDDGHAVDPTRSRPAPAPGTAARPGHDAVAAMSGRAR